MTATRPTVRRPRLALAMIARDEERSIARALRSVAPYVDELLVVDTGSTDKTRAIARRCGARVERFEWIDDFAAARNFAIDCCESPWSLVLDADEWIVSGGERLRDFAIGGHAFGAVKCRSTFGDDGAFVVDASIRLLPPGARYQGEVHEQPVGDFPVHVLATVVGHDGYDPEQVGAKLGRNEAILRKRLQNEKDSGYLWFQLGCDLDIQGRFEEASDAFAEALHLTDDVAGWRHPLVARSVYAMKSAGRHVEALGIVAREQQIWPDSPDVWFVTADLLMEMGASEPNLAPQMSHLVERAWRRCLEIGERPDLPGAVRGRGSYLARRNLDTFDKLRRDRAAGHDS